MAEPSVSVIIPTFNRSAMLKEAVEGALRQTLPPQEIIVVDDGSTDDTPALMQQLCRENKTLRYLRQQANSGGDKARQRGFGECSAEFVAFLDSDDWWLPEHLAACTEAMRGVPDSALVFTQYGLADAQRRALTDVVREPRLSQSPLRSIVFKRIIVQYSRTLYRRSALARIGGVPDSITADDWVINSQLAALFPAGVIQLERKTVVFRVHGTQSASDPGRVCDCLQASTDAIFSRLPEAVQNFKPGVSAINFMHSSVFFWHAGCWRDAWRCFGKALRADRLCLRWRDAWVALPRLCVPPVVGRWLRRGKRQWQRSLA